MLISHNPEAILRKEIGKHFKLKEEYIGAPLQYLGGKLRQMEMQNGQECWAFGSTQYVREAVNNAEEYLGKKGEKLTAKVLTPLANKYCPEVDISATRPGSVLLSIPDWYSQVDCLIGSC